jgi:type III pantothenate kinase
MQALSGNAAQLPEIPLELPERPLGSNTVEAMNSGILWGFVGQVTFMIDKIKSEVDYNITTIATGGLSEVLKPLEDKFDIIDRNLTIQGIYEFFKLVQADQLANREG